MKTVTLSEKPQITSPKLFDGLTTLHFRVNEFQAPLEVRVTRAELEHLVLEIFTKTSSPERLLAQAVQVVRGNHV